MSTILTAEELIDKLPTIESLSPDDKIMVAQNMKAFARLHVEKALKVASENAYTKTESRYTGGIKGDGLLYEDVQVIDADSIINSYPLELIK